MMKWSNFKYLFSISQFFTGDLYNNGKGLKDKNNSHNYQYSKRIGKKCHESEIRSECETSNISHIKLCWLNVKPEKRNKCSTNTHTECREEKKSLIVGNIAVYSIRKKEESSSKTIEPISDINTIGSSDDDEYKEWNKEESYLKSWKIGEFEKYFWPTKLIVKPPRTECSKYKEPKYLKLCRKSFYLSDSLDVHIIIDSSKYSYRKKCKKTEIGFFLIEEWIIGKSKFLKEHRDTYHEKYRDKYQGSSHRRCSSLVGVKFEKFKCFSGNAFFAYLFSEFESL